MSQIENNVTVVKLAEPTKDLLKLMHFETIPEEAKYLAFFPDGDAQFFEALDVIGQNSVNINVIYYHGVTLEF